MKSYKDFSYCLNNKYKISEFDNQINENNKILKNELSSKLKKKLIRIFYVGTVHKIFKNFIINNIIEELQDKYIFKFTPNNPDYLLYDEFYSREYLNPKFDKSIKIAIYTENQIPDFNKADYVVGFHNINYIDRYFKKSSFIWNFEMGYKSIKNKNFIIIKKKVLKIKIRKKFCAAVISNYHHSNKFRIKFIKELSKYKVVDMGGKFMNNIGGIVKNKIKFLSYYKFSISMENSEGQGYISEKIIDSFIAGTIPIYYGGYMIDEFINLLSFILIRNEKDMKEKIEYIKKIDNDEKLYKSFLKKNLFINDTLPKIIKKEQNEFFDNIFEQEKEKAKRIDNYHLNIKYYT